MVLRFLGRAGLNRPADLPACAAKEAADEDAALRRAEEGPVHGVTSMLHSLGLEDLEVSLEYSRSERTCWHAR
jgi:hypothetical protein